MSLLINKFKFVTLRHVNVGFKCIQKTASTSSVPAFERDPLPVFTDAETQNLLRSMTQLQLHKVFRKRTVPDNSSQVKFMTDDQLEDEFSATIKAACHQLQMPPVVQVRKEVERIISRDSALSGFADTKYVFTDITYGLRQTDRKVVVRDTDGTLAYATLDTAKRLNQLYFPLKGRKIRVPRMFSEPEHFKRCLDEHKYEFVLDRLIVQYEPHELAFHDISSKVYEHLNESRQFDLLRSTRHFGPMAFYYAWQRTIDDLLYDMIRRDYLQNAVELIALSYKIHNIPVEYKETLQRVAELQPTREERALNELRSSIKSAASTAEGGIQQEIQSAIGKSAQDFEADEICLRFIEAYIGSEHALKKVQLELAVQTLKEINAEKKQLYDGLRKAHGVSTH